MQGDQVRALRILAEAKGWDPSKIDGKPIEVGLTIRKPNSTGDVSLSPFPGPPGDAATYDNPEMSSAVTWSDPGEQTNADRRTKNANPVAGMPGA